MLEKLIQGDTFVFDKTGTLTEGVFHVKDVVPFNEMKKDELLETAALAESYSKHPVAVSLMEAYGREADKTRVTEIEEQPGYGVHAMVDGRAVYAGTTRLMDREQIQYQRAG